MGKLVKEKKHLQINGLKKTKQTNKQKTKNKISLIKSEMNTKRV